MQAFGTISGGGGIFVGDAVAVCEGLVRPEISYRHFGQVTLSGVASCLAHEAGFFLSTDDVNYRVECSSDPEPQFTPLDLTLNQWGPLALTLRFGTLQVCTAGLLLNESLEPHVAEAYEGDALRLEPGSGRYRLQLAIGIVEVESALPAGSPTEEFHVAYRTQDCPALTRLGDDLAMRRLTPAAYRTAISEFPHLKWAWLIHAHLTAGDVNDSFPIPTKFCADWNQPAVDAWIDRKWPPRLQQN